MEAEDLESTWKFRQKEIAMHVDKSSQKKQFTLKLPELGPYSLDYTRNGRHMLIGGRKGHIASFDWKSGKLESEIQVYETVKDVKWLHNETMYAVAQKKYTFIYDNQGTELHCLKEHIEVNRLEFLPFHFLLSSIGNSGYLKYHDTSTGQFVSELHTKLGRCDAMAQNPFNAIIHLGHVNGTVTLWSPTMTTPLVKMLCHRGPVQALAIDSSGKYMSTTGLDGQLKIWDIRTFKLVDHYFTPSPASHLSISQKGLLAVGYGPHLSIYKDIFKEKQKDPYMKHMEPSCRLSDIQFCPFEDILGMGHSKGISSLIIPGSGEPNYDTMELNPFQTKKQRQQTEVHSLLEKIQPDMITLNPHFVGSIDRAHADVIKEEAKREWEANHPTEKFVPKKKAKGKSSSLRRYLRKQSNVIDSKRVCFLFYDL